MVTPPKISKQIFRKVYISTCSFSNLGKECSLESRDFSLEEVRLVDLSKYAINNIENNDHIGKGHSEDSSS